MEHRGIEYQIKIGITKHEWRGPSAPHPPSKARLVALGMTPSTLLSEPSNNGATNTPMTANHQTDRPPQAGGLLLSGRQEPLCSILHRLAPQQFAMNPPSRWCRGATNVYICRVSSVCGRKISVGGTRRWASSEPPH